MVNHCDFRFCVALESVENLVIFLSDHVFGLKPPEKIKSVIVSLKPAEYSEIKMKNYSPN